MVVALASSGTLQRSRVVFEFGFLFLGNKKKTVIDASLASGKYPETLRDSFRFIVGGAVDVKGVLACRWLSSWCTSDVDIGLVKQTHKQTK